MKNRRVSKDRAGVIILLFLIFSSCTPEPEPKLCGPYATSEKCQQGDTCLYTSLPDSEIEIRRHPEAGIITGYNILEGNSIVFKYYLNRPPHPVYSDLDYIEELLFQIPANFQKENFLIEASEFRDHNVFFRSVSFSTAGILKEDRGCISLTKVSEGVWEVNVNVGYMNFLNEECHTLQFSEIFSLADKD